MPDRYVIDSNIHDRLADDPEALQLATQLVEAGELVLLTTHVQLDEIVRAPDRERVSRLLTVPAQRVRTYGFVLDVSRLDEARLSVEEPYGTLRGGNPDHAEDALIASTAQYEDATLVTEDKQLLRRAQAQGIRAVNWHAFRERLVELAPD